MRISVLYFAVFRERLGRDGEALELADRRHASPTRSPRSPTRHAVIASLRGKFRVAVNQDFVDDDHALADGDELALIPPVAGGASPRRCCTGEPLSLDRCIAAVARSRTWAASSRSPAWCGAHSHGATIDHLEYEAYGAMAIREMTRAVRRDRGARSPARALAVEHRVGRLAVGDVAVVIAAAAPHRAEAFTACRAMIDRLKDRVPIWKKEVGDDGAEWVGLGP